MSDKAMPLDDARKDALKDTAARKRMAALFDSDTFVEVGALVKNGCDGAGVITGYGLVDVPACEVNFVCLVSAAW